MDKVKPKFGSVLKVFLRNKLDECEIPVKVLASVLTMILVFVLSCLLFGWLLHRCTSFELDYSGGVFLAYLGAGEVVWGFILLALLVGAVVYGIIRFPIWLWSNWKKAVEEVCIDYAVEQAKKRTPEEEEEEDLAYFRKTFLEGLHLRLDGTPMSPEEVKEHEAKMDKAYGRSK
jgi:hypothetical protein